MKIISICSPDNCSHDLETPSGAKVTIGPFPQRLQCLCCLKNVRTTIVATPRPLSSFGPVVMYFCCLWPLFLIPYCFNSCYQIAHFCPECGNFIGTYTP